MILSDQANSRVSRLALVAVFLLAIAALPAWSIGEDRAAPSSPPSAADGAKSDKAKLAGRIFVSAYFRDEKNEFSRAIIAVDPNTGTWKKMTDDGSQPRVSPDGETLAYQRDRKIWTCDTQGANNPGRIADVHGRPIWSPDGKHLILSPWRYEGENKKKTMRFSTYKVSLETFGKTQLDIPATDSASDWSPDGKWLITASNRDDKAKGWQLFIMRLDGTQSRHLSKKDGQHVFARFSPDSRRIAYVYSTSGVSSIRMVDIDGKNDREVLRAKGVMGLHAVAWSPSGKHLAVVVFEWALGEDGQKFVGAGNDHKHRLLMMEADGSNQREVQVQVEDNQKILELGLPHWK